MNDCYILNRIRLLKKLNKKMANINIKIEKKDLWLLSAIMIFLIAVGYVVAYGGSQPISMGHSFGELENVQAKITNGMTACSAANQAIKTINSTTGIVTCEVDDNTVSGLVIGWFSMRDGTCMNTWGITSGCACTSIATTLQTGSGDSAGGVYTFYLCVRN